MVPTRSDATRRPIKAIDPYFEGIWGIIVQIIRYILGLFRTLPV